MENRFCLVSCRFQVYDRQSLLIWGNFEKPDEKRGRMVLSLDYQRLSYRIERSETGKYLIWVRLPEDFVMYKELRAFQYEGTEIEEVFRLSVKWLDKQKEKQPFYIDEALYHEDGWFIKGWYIHKKDQTICVRGRNGKQIEADDKKVLRSDVEEAYPECSKDDIHGFEIRSLQRARHVTLEIGTGHVLQNKEVKLAPLENYQRRQKRNEWVRKVRVYYQQFGMRRTLWRSFEKLTQKESTTYHTYRFKTLPGPKELERQREARFICEPEYGIVVPLYRTPDKYLNAMISSVKAQTYGKWKLYLSDGSGKNSPLTKKLKIFAEADERIIVIENEEQLRIAENTNQALRLVTEDFVVFMDHDDMISPDALYECTKVLNAKKDTDIIYTDEDKISMDGKEFYQPHFKSDFNLDLLRSANYMCHLYVARTKLLHEVGFLNSEYEGSQDYDLILRCVEATDRIEHIPKVLYHWRAHAQSTAGNPESKDYAYIAGQKAIEAHYERVGIDAKVHRLTRGFYRSEYKIHETPLISVIIPNKDHVEDLKRCLDSILKKTSYPNLEFLIVENNSREQDTFDYYELLKSKYEQVKLLYFDEPFNYSAINNFAVQYARGDYLLLLNNDTQALREDCIEELVVHCMRKHVGVVGAKLLYPDQTIQHAGVIVGLGGIAGHAFLGQGRKELGYFARINCLQEYSAVTGACMMVKKSVYEEAGGLDEAFAVAFNDVDFCLRVKELGYKIIYNPFAELYHYESKTRGIDDTKDKRSRFEAEVSLFAKRWEEFLQRGDPCYNPNLTLAKHDFSLKI